MHILITLVSFLLFCFDLLTNDNKSLNPCNYLYYNTLKHFVLRYGRPWDKLREKKKKKVKNLTKIHLTVGKFNFL